MQETGSSDNRSPTGLSGADPLRGDEDLLRAKSYSLLSPSRLITYAVQYRKALSTSLLNQALSSATNFALSFALVRILSTTDYGSYTIGIAVCYLYAGIGNSMFLIQMVVHTPDKAPSDRSPYAVRILVAVLLFSAATILVTILCLFAIGTSIPTLRSYAQFALCVTAASVSFTIKDYFTRHAYLVRSESRAFSVTATIAVSLAVLLAAVFALRVRLTAERALLIFATSQLAGAATGLAVARLPLRSFCWRLMLNDLSECWHHGRWAIGSSVVSWLQTQAYAYLTLLIAGAAAVGRANAARLLVSPFLLLTPAINQVTMPRLAGMRARDPRRMLRAGTGITFALVALGVLYSVLLLLGSETVVPAVVGPKYTGMRGLVAAWCVVLLTVLIRDGATTLFQAMKRFRALTASNVVSASVSIASVFVLMQFWGAGGAVLGGAAGELTQGALLWRSLRREMALPDDGAEVSPRSEKQPR
jgi:O-antigen/teichoic acid export membrane protein